MATLGTGYDTRAALRRLSRGLLSKGRPAPAGRPLRLSRAGRRRRRTRREARRARRAGRELSALGSASCTCRSAIRRASCRSRTMRGCCAARRRRAATPRTAASSTCAARSVQDLIDAGILFCGTPDQVYEQIVDFCEYCGGMGNLLMMGHAGFHVARRHGREPHAVRAARCCRGSRPTSSRWPPRPPPDGYPVRAPCRPAPASPARRWPPAWQKAFRRAPAAPRPRSDRLRARSAAPRPAAPGPASSP